MPEELTGENGGEGGRNPQAYGTPVEVGPPLDGWLTRAILVSLIVRVLQRRLWLLVSVLRGNAEYEGCEFRLALSVLGRGVRT